MRAIFILICKGFFLGNVFSFLHVRCTALLHVCSDYDLNWIAHTVSLSWQCYSTKDGSLFTW